MGNEWTPTDGEWAKLTPGDEDRDFVPLYRTTKAPPYEVALGFQYQGELRKYHISRIVPFSDAELLNLIIATGLWREVPEVMTLFDTMKEIAGGSCCQTPGCCIDDPMCTAMTARAAVARFNDHEQ